MRPLLRGSLEDEIIVGGNAEAGDLDLEVGDAVAAGRRIGGDGLKIDLVVLTLG